MTSSILERTVRYTPLNEQYIRGIVQRAIETGREIERMNQQQKVMLEEIRDIRRSLD